MGIQIYSVTEMQSLQQTYDETHADLQGRDTNDIIKNYAAIIYRTSNSECGAAASLITPERPTLHGFNGKFSAHLQASGMPANNGLNTQMEKDRYLDFARTGRTRPCEYILHLN